MIALVIIPLLLRAATTGALVRGGQRPTRVVVLYQQQAETAPMMEFTQRLRFALRDKLGGQVEFYQEALDLDRFTGFQQSSALAKYFDDKYRNFGVDVVVPVGSGALKFALGPLRQILPDVPIVFALCAEPQVNPTTLPRDVTGRLAPPSRFTATLAMARSLQPDAERIIVVGGAGGADSASVSAALSATTSLGGSLPVSRMQGLPLDDLLRALREVPRRSIVIFANYRRDPHGQAFEPLDIVGSIARASAAPMYVQLRTYVGEGVVGGYVTRFDMEGEYTGRLVARVLRRRPDEPLPPVESIPNSFVADARAMHRWALSAQRLPPGTELLFRELTTWQRFRPVVLPGLGIVGAESLLIGSLLVERRRRKRAQLALEELERGTQETRRQVAHLARLAIVGELAATISHELRQPLAAIRANAETGAQIVAREPSDATQAREIFDDIVADNKRAVAVIESMRRLLRRSEPVAIPVDLNLICREAAHLLRHEANLRKARIELTLSDAPLIVLSDPIELQQVVLNLIINALEAAGSGSTEPVVIVRTTAHAHAVELIVQDNGAGVPEDVRPHVFESFFSTKDDGLGLGLAIVRSIVERQGGRIRVSGCSLGGAEFSVYLPTRSDAHVAASGVGSAQLVATSSRPTPSASATRLM